MLSTDEIRSWSAIVHSNSVPAGPVRRMSSCQVATRAREPNSAITSTIRR